MEIASLALVVLASFIHASWNLLAKRAAAAGVTFVFAYSVIACVVYAPWVLYLLIQGGIHLGWQGIGLIMLSGLIHLGYSLSLQKGYRVADLSIVYPIARGTGPMLSVVGAFLILGETPTGLGLSGLLCVVAGILLIATQGKLAAFFQPKAQSGLRWGTTTGGFIASYTVIDAYAVKVVGIPPVVLDWFSNLLRVALLLPVILANPRRALGVMRGHWWTAVGVGMLSPLSYILVLFALRSGASLSIVAPMREMSMMVGVLMGMLILRERVGPWRLIGCAVLILGVVLLSLS